MVVPLEFFTPNHQPVYPTYVLTIVDDLGKTSVRKSAVWIIGHIGRIFGVQDLAGQVLRLGTRCNPTTASAPDP